MHFGAPGSSSVQQNLEQSSNGRAFAVIYGTGNRAGVTYAHYLAEKGFNLILIERDIQPLNDLENQLKEKFANMAASMNNGVGGAKGKGAPTPTFQVVSPVIYKVVLNKFDQEALAVGLNHVKDLPVKLIINCKNSRMKGKRPST